MRKFQLFISLSILINISILISCKKTNNKNPNFIVTDYNPDIVIEKDDTVFFDINQDGKNDFKAFQRKYSSIEEPMFESVDTSCLLSIGITHSHIVQTWIFYNDSINDKLTWETNISWVVTESVELNHKVYLAIRLEDNSNFYYGWLLPKVEESSGDFYTLHIDKSSFCKVKNQTITAGQAN